MRLKYLGGLMGFTIGNAVGFPLDSKNRADLLKKPVTKMLENEEYNTPKGTWSDSTSLLISTIDSINTKNGIDLDDIALKLVSYKTHSRYTALNDVLDMDRTTSIAIDKYDNERKDPSSCGLTEEDSNTNGSLMRILPIAFYAIEKHLKDFEIRDLVRQISSITHANDISVMGCYIFTRFVMFLLNGKDKYSAYSMTKCVDCTMFSEEAQEIYKRLLKEDITKLKVNEINSTNHIVDTLESSFWVFLKSNSYKESIVGAINLGGATSQIAAITGSLAGIVYGYDLLPEEWEEKIALKDYLLDIFEEFSENKYE